MWMVPREAGKAVSCNAGLSPCKGDREEGRLGGRILACSAILTQVQQGHWTVLEPKSLMFSIPAMSSHCREQSWEEWFGTDAVCQSTAAEALDSA